MSKWFPSLYDRVMKLEKSSKMDNVRKNIIHQAHGRVLEIGSGTGINFPLYKHVDSVDAIDPNRGMMQKSQKRIELASVPIHLHEQSTEALSFPANMFDSVISTLVFCTIPDPIKALENIQHVAKPGATLLFLEHVKMKQTVIAKTQDFLTPVWKRVADGCHLNRDTLALIEESDLEIKEVKSYYKGLLIAVTCYNIS